MISFLSGTILEKEVDTITVLTEGGVGYTIGMSRLFASELTVGNVIELPVYLRVTDSALDLFGFRSSEERGFFKLLLSVSGVGPKSAMNILNLGSIDEIKAAIARKDVAYLTAVQGMGKKTAERLVVELKSKIGSIETAHSDEKVGDVLKDVIDGLVAMGYSKEDARDAATSVELEGKGVEDVLREALQSLSK